MKDEIVTVIIPVYNYEKYLNLCIDSVLNQTYKNIDVILVDDGSTDSSGKICDEYAHDDRVRVIHKENGGLSSARNAGMKIAQGDWVTFLDSDDFLKETFVERTLLTAKKYDADIVQALMDEGTDRKFKPDKSKEPLVITPNEAIKNFDYKVSACSKLFKREIADAVEFPEGLIHEDDATYYRFAYNAKKVCILWEYLYYRYFSFGGIMRNNKKNKKTDFITVYNERIKFFEEKKDEDLLRATHDRYCLVLMLWYIAFIKEDTNKDDRQRVLDLFYSERNLIKKDKNVPIMHRLRYLIFAISPNLVTRAILLLHLR